MDKNLMDEINKFNSNQLRTLFFQTYGWMKNEYNDDITKAIESSMIDARKDK